MKNLNALEIQNLEKALKEKQNLLEQAIKDDVPLGTTKQLRLDIRILEEKLKKLDTPL